MTLLLIFLLCFFAYTNAWQQFHNGRLKHGNVPPPSGPNPRSSGVKEQYFPQNLDHFDPTNTDLWQQRYFVNDEFYHKNNRTVFLMIGGESQASAKWMNNGAWIDSAKLYGALCFQVEHRYYGESIPTKNLSTENLVYLTSQQAIADLAAYIAAMNEKYKLSENVRWIAFGGSYAGSLAAWLRQVYPHLVHGAVSSSGPLLAMVDFEDYYSVVAKDLIALHSQECFDAVDAGTKQFDAVLNSSNNATLNKLFNLCVPIEGQNNDLDIGILFLSLAGNFASIAQYNNGNGIKGSDSVTVNTLCNIMTNKTIGDELRRLAAVNHLILNGVCLNYNYSSLIEFLKQDDVNYNGARQWIYQTCTEFGFYQSSAHKPQIFGTHFPVHLSIAQCMDIFDSKFSKFYLEKVVNRTNILYGGMDIKISNVVYVHGTVDPWHVLGITQTHDPQAPAIFINGTAHCANMYSKSDFDLPELTAARNKVDELLGKWLKQ